MIKLNTFIFILLNIHSVFSWLQKGWFRSTLKTVPNRLYLVFLTMLHGDGVKRKHTSSVCHQPLVNSEKDSAVTAAAARQRAARVSAGGHRQHSGARRPSAQGVSIPRCPWHVYSNVSCHPFLFLMKPSLMQAKPRCFCFIGKE